MDRDYIERIKISDRHFSKNVRFHPYIGNNYENGIPLSKISDSKSSKKIKVLVIGESVYSDTNEDWNTPLKKYFSSEVGITEQGEILDVKNNEALNVCQSLPLLHMNNWILSKRKEHISLWKNPNESDTEARRKIKGSGTYTKFINKVFNGLERTEFWNNVAFYEYVQSWLKTANDRPTDDQWGCSENAFFEVLEELKPDISIAWGQALYEKMPQCKKNKSGDKLLENIKYPYYEYILANGKVSRLMWVNHPARPEFYNSNFDWNSILETLAEL